MYYRLTDRTVTPPNGFIVRLKAGNERVERQWWDFVSAVRGFIQIAAANPSLGLPTNPEQAAQIVDVQNAERVARMAGASSYVVAVAGDLPVLARTSVAPNVKTCCGAKR